MMQNFCFLRPTNKGSLYKNEDASWNSAFESELNCFFFTKNEAFGVFVEVYHFDKTSPLNQGPQFEMKTTDVTE